MAWVWPRKRIVVRIAFVVYLPTNPNRPPPGPRLSTENTGNRSGILETSTEMAACLVLFLLQNRPFQWKHVWISRCSGCCAYIPKHNSASVLCPVPCINLALVRRDIHQSQLRFSPHWARICQNHIEYARIVNRTSSPPLSQRHSLQATAAQLRNSSFLIMHNSSFLIHNSSLLIKISSSHCQPPQPAAEPSALPRWGRSAQPRTISPKYPRKLIVRPGLLGLLTAASWPCSASNPALP